MIFIHFPYLWAVLIIICNSYEIYFTRTYTCISDTTNECETWNDTVSLSYDLFSITLNCFPEGTLVMSEKQGPKPIENIQIGDKILGYDFSEGKNTFSEVYAWLHRDTQGKLQFSEIQTESGQIYFSSSGHNIAYYNNDEKISFKFLQNLGQQQFLVTNDLQKLKIKYSKQLKMMRGLYSPITKNNNFYIFPQQANQTSPMILVHCLSQIQNPVKYEYIISTILELLDYIGLNQHKSYQIDNYEHPLMKVIKYFGQKGRKIRYQAPQIVTPGKGNLQKKQLLQLAKKSNNLVPSDSSNTVGRASGDDRSYQYNRLAVLFTMLYMQQVPMSNY